MNIELLCEIVFVLVQDEPFNNDMTWLIIRLRNVYLPLYILPFIYFIYFTEDDVITRVFQGIITRKTQDT